MWSLKKCDFFYFKWILDLLDTVHNHFFIQSSVIDYLNCIKMFKLTQLNRCTACTSICSQTVLRTISINFEQHDPEQVKSDLSRLRKTFEFGFDKGGRRKRILSKVDRSHIHSVKSILEVNLFYFDYWTIFNSIYFK